MTRSIAHVIGFGLSCPVGLVTGPALAAMKADVVSFVERDDVAGIRGSVTASCLEGWGLPWSDRLERAAFFARHAMSDALARARALPPGPLPLVLALPGANSGSRIDAKALVAKLARVRGAVDDPLELRLLGTVEEGRAGAFKAVDLAVAALEHAPLVCVAGVDSMADDDTLAALAREGRVLSSRNRDGIIPGEGAAVVLLGHPALMGYDSSTAALIANVTTYESMPFERQEQRISNADGLTGVLRELWTRVGSRVDQVFEGTSGESYYNREFGHAYLRQSQLMPEPLRRLSVNATLGDVGAAAGAVALVHAIFSVGPRGPANRNPNRLALAYASSDAGLVGGCVVSSAR